MKRPEERVRDEIEELEGLLEQRRDDEPSPTSAWVASVVERCLARRRRWLRASQDE